MSVLVLVLRAEEVKDKKNGVERSFTYTPCAVPVRLYPGIPSAH